MNSTLLEQPETTRTDSQLNVDVQQYQNRKTGWLLEMSIWGIGAGVCTLLSGMGFYFLIAEGFRPVNLVVAFSGVVGTKAIISNALKRHEFYQDKSPKITLSSDAICDHRTGVNVEFLDAQSYFFDQIFVKGNEVRASLHIGMKDGEGHFFDLRSLSVPAKEIAQTVQSISGLESVKPAVSSDPNQDRLLVIIAVVMVSLLVIKIILGVFGI